MRSVRKQPAETIRVVFDFTDVMASAATVASITSIGATNCNVVQSSASLTVSGQSYAGKKVTCFAAGGTSGESYKLTAIAVDSDGQTLELDGYVEVLDE